jgi:hypothetical protein
VRVIQAPSPVPLPTAALHLGALSALAIAQPLCDLISKNPDFLAARRLIGWQVVTLGLVLVPPLLALAVEALLGLASRPLPAAVHPTEELAPRHSRPGRPGRPEPVRAEGSV